MNVFEAVRDSVSARQAAEAFGIKVNRSGMACCPFHNDKHPSMKVDKRFHCFGCQADGDAIDLTARLFDLSKKDAAVKLADIFCISYEGIGVRPRASPVKPNLTPDQIYRRAEKRTYQAYCDYLQMLYRWKERYAPKSMDAEWEPRFIEACQKISYIEYILDEVFLSGSIRDRAEFVKNHAKEVVEIERRVFFDLNAGRTGSCSEGGTDPEQTADQKAESGSGIHGTAL